MKFERLTAALVSGLMLWGTAYAEQQPETTTPEATGATAPGIVILELQGGQPGAQQGSPEEMLAMQLLLLQLLMMQGDPAAGADVPIAAPGAKQGIGI